MRAGDVRAGDERAGDKRAAGETRAGVARTEPPTPDVRRLRGCDEPRPRRESTSETGASLTPMLEASSGSSLLSLMLRSSFPSTIVTALSFVATASTNPRSSREPSCSSSTGTDLEERRDLTDAAVDGLLPVLAAIREFSSLSLIECDFWQKSAVLSSSSQNSIKSLSDMV